jgi:hypothetical protein
MFSQWLFGYSAGYLSGIDVGHQICGFNLEIVMIIFCML